MTAATRISVDSLRSALEAQLPPIVRRRVLETVDLLEWDARRQGRTTIDGDAVRQALLESAPGRGREVDRAIRLALGPVITAWLLGLIDSDEDDDDDDDDDDLTEEETPA